MAKHDLRYFLVRVFKELNSGTEFKDNWHLDYLCYELMRTMPLKPNFEGTPTLNPTPDFPLRRLIINVPPRSLKSILVSVALTAFILGHYPYERIIGASYSGKLSSKLNGDVRKVMMSEWYRKMFPQTIIEKDTESKLTTTVGGHRIATSVGGTITGEGGNFLFGDDLIKPQDALSVQIREDANEWMGETLFTRSDDDEIAVKILLMQRLSEGDPTDFLLEMNKDLPLDKQWVLIKLPAVAEETQVFHYFGQKKEWVEGEPLHPTRFSAAVLAAKLAEIKAYAYAGQYMQRPAPRGGGMVNLEWFKRYRELPDIKTVRKIVHSWDTAGSISKQNDPSVCTTWWETQTGIYLVDVTRVWLAYPQLKKLIYQKWLDDKPTVILIENKSSGQALIQDLQTINNMPLIKIDPVKDKMMRMDAETPLIEAGKVWLPEHAPWLGVYELEIAVFPASKRDDQVDSTSQALKWIRERGAYGARVRVL